MDSLPPLFMAVVSWRSSGLLLASFVESRSLGNAVIVTFPHNTCIRREGQKALDGLSVACELGSILATLTFIPNFDVSSTINLGPDTQDIFTASDA